ASICTGVVPAREAGVLFERDERTQGKLGPNPLDAVVAGRVVDDDDLPGLQAVGNQRSHGSDRVLGRPPVEDDRGRALEDAHAGCAVRPTSEAGPCSVRAWSSSGPNRSWTSAAACAMWGPSPRARCASLASKSTQPSSKRRQPAVAVSPP